MFTPGAGQVRPIVAHASIGQWLRLTLAEKFGIGSAFTRLAIKAEIVDRLNPEVADPHVTPAALLNLCEEIGGLSPTEGYQLLARPVSENDQNDNRVWFDAIEGLTDQRIVQAVADTAFTMMRGRGNAWEKAIDLGAATGTLASLLANYGGHETAHSITLLDQVPELLGVASQRYGERMQYVTGSVLQLPFQNNSFDLAVSGGLVYSLGREAQTGYFTEVGRILRPGGLYIDGDQNKWQWTTENPGRSQLCGLIKACVEGPEIIGDPLEGIDKAAFFSHVGLVFSERTFPDPPHEPVTVRLLQKPAAS